MNNLLTSRFVFKMNNLKKNQPVMRLHNKSKPVGKTFGKKKSNMEWGTATWQLFHWFAANINEEFYELKQKQIHALIYKIVNSLPCPTCKEHAISFMKSNNISLAKTKQLFERYLFFFHNKVNERRNVLLESYDILKNYKTMNGRQVINYWLSKFKNNLGVDMSNFTSKQQILTSKQNMINFIQNNSIYFDNL